MLRLRAATVFFLIITGTVSLWAGWVEDITFKFKIEVPETWQKNSFDDGSDRVHVFVSPDNNLAIRIRAFEVNEKVSLDLITSLFKNNILGKCEQLALMEDTINGYEGKIGAYKGLYNGIEVGAGAFFTIQKNIAYIVWSVTPIGMFQKKAAESDKITNTFTVLDENQTPTPAVPEADEEKYKLSSTFSDTGLGYSIKYPSEWVYSKIKPHIVMFSGKENTPAYYATINIQNLASTLIGGKFNTIKDAEDHFYQQLRSGTLSFSASESKTFTFSSGGRNITGTVSFMTYSRENEDFKQLMIIFPRHDRKLFYAVMYTAPKEDYDTYYPVAVEMLNTMVIE